MFDVGLNLPHLTDAGARELRIAAEVMGARAGERLVEKLAEMVPSTRTTLLVAGGLFLLGSGWLALGFYRASQLNHVSRAVDRHGRDVQSLAECARVLAARGAGGEQLAGSGGGSSGSGSGR